jgi:hypothetical protein
VLKIRKQGRDLKKMRDLFEFAEFLTSAWKLANDGERLPTSHGVLDAALFELKDQLPQRFHDTLSFGNTRVGFRCYELPDVLYCAQANLLTSEPNPTYLTTQVQIEQGTARRLMRRQNIGADAASAFGKHLKSAIERAKARADEEQAA